MTFRCIECRAENAKELAGEDRPYFCGRLCATRYALKIAKKLADCPKCGGHFTHRRSGGPHFDNERRCTECEHTWEPR